VIRSGIELDRFGSTEVLPAWTRVALGIPAEAPVVGSVTRLSKQKAPLVLLQALKMVAERVPKGYFVIVGNGPLRQEVEARISQFGLTERLILTGIRRDIPDLIAIFDVFALSSLWEGLPRVIPQAMAHGLPVVVSAVDGALEIIDDRVNGRLVPPGDSKAMAEAVIELLENPQLRAQLGKSGRKSVPEFDVTTMVRKIEDLYEQLLVEHKLRPSF
jgi:glycosyltransferase involved in cell wall biosynthesis